MHRCFSAAFSFTRSQVWPSKAAASNLGRHSEHDAGCQVFVFGECCSRSEGACCSLAGLGQQLLRRSHQSRGKKALTRSEVDSLHPNQLSYHSHRGHLHRPGLNRPACDPLAMAPVLMLELSQRESFCPICLQAGLHMKALARADGSDLKGTGALCIEPGRGEVSWAHPSLAAQ